MPALPPPSTIRGRSSNSRASRAPFVILSTLVVTYFLSGYANQAARNTGPDISDKVTEHFVPEFNHDDSSNSISEKIDFPPADENIRASQDDGQATGDTQHDDSTDVLHEELGGANEASQNAVEGETSVRDVPIREATDETAQLSEDHQVSIEKDQSLPTSEAEADAAPTSAEDTSSSHDVTLRYDTKESAEISQTKEAAVIGNSENGAVSEQKTAVDTSEIDSASPIAPATVTNTSEKDSALPIAPVGALVEKITKVSGEDEATVTRDSQDPSTVGSEVVSLPESSKSVSVDSANGASTAEELVSGIKTDSERASTNVFGDSTAETTLAETVDQTSALSRASSENGNDATADLSAGKGVGVATSADTSEKVVQVASTTGGSATLKTVGSSTNTDAISGQSEHATDDVESAGDIGTIGGASTNIAAKVAEEDGSQKSEGAEVGVIPAVKDETNILGQESVLKKEVAKTNGSDSGEAAAVMHGLSTGDAVIQKSETGQITDEIPGQLTGETETALRAAESAVNEISSNQGEVGRIFDSSGSATQRDTSPAGEG